MRCFLLIAVIFLSSLNSFSDDVYKNYRQDWLRKAEQFKPQLHTVEKKARTLVEIVQDENAFQNYRAVPVGDIQEYYDTTLRRNDPEHVIDFGEHMVGTVWFVIRPTIPAHAPLQLRIKFGEMPAEIHEPFDSYKGTLSKAWLQEEILTIHTMPDTIVLPCRYAFRFLKIEPLAFAGDMDFYISDITCNTTTSAGNDVGATELDLSLGFSQIEKVAISTLRDCMQTVFEDGPKRDRRIWIGDFKLQALANYCTFNNIDLVKRGLYLYAATANDNGLLYGTLFEKPYPHPQLHVPIDYCLLYNSMLLDYYQATNDEKTVLDLWPVALYQVKNVLPCITNDGLFEPSSAWWYFIDWNDQLDKGTALHGIVIKTLSETWQLATLLHKEDDLDALPAILSKMKNAARMHYYDQGTGLFKSGKSGQISTASQAWMILAGVVSPDEGQQLFDRLGKEDRVVKPVSPYMYHYVLEAMMRCEMYGQAREFLLSYWGGMIDKGADTFWEVYDPDDDYLSPYNSYLVNSYCHAWSCTPVYFIRKYHKELFD